uniref:uncharacterized protein LOC122596115 n=1 Tax=Erigeron canadensis TaxID=72917 RepID=UPI001CB9CE3A|nr:uncharacterized protein LOC122596115 [Erigeron canadensis]
MECNRDEATRAKEIAESKFSNKDITGAKKFALKAQSLYPDLDGISQFLAILDVHVAAENKFNGELDFYGILGVNPLADDDTVRKHYRKLALALHPDKNKSIGADRAFQYVSEAWNLLSDKNKRSVYDHKRNVRVFKQKVQTQNGGSRPPNGFHYFTKATAAQKVKAKDTPTTTTTTKAKDTATTTKAKDTFTKTKDNTAKGKESTVKRKDTTNKVNDTAAKAMDVTTDAKDMTDSQKEKVKANPIKTGPTSVPSSSNKQMVSKTFWTVCKRCKLQYEFRRMYVNKNLLCPTCYGPFLAIETPPPNINAFSEVPESSQEAGKTVMNVETCKTVKVEPAHGTNSQWVPFSKVSSPADVAQAATLVQQTYQKVKRDREEAQATTKREKALRRKIAKNEAKLSSQHLNSMKTKQDVDALVATNETGPTVVKKDVSDTDIKNCLVNKSRMEIKKKLHEWSSETVKDSKDHEMDVPDSDFHNFDHDRSEMCFEEGQVWAAYDDPDGMPRSYAMIRKVISVDPFKMKVCWLDPKPGKKEAFGEFKAGNIEIVSAPNYFSHKANFTKQESGNVLIFPKIGDVCALYRNDQTLGLVKDKYEIVEVDQYNEVTGITVTPLVKVAGFKTVFHRHLDPKETRVFLKKEMSQFSYQIPSYLLTGQESPSAPKGCFELDPASVPPEFLQVGENVKNVDEAANVKCHMSDKDGGLAEVKELDNMEVEECSKY